MAHVSYEVVKRIGNDVEPYSVIKTVESDLNGSIDTVLIGSYDSYPKACMAIRKIEILDGQATNYSIYIPCTLMNMIDERCRVSGKKRSRSAVITEILLEYFCDYCPDTSNPL